VAGELAFDGGFPLALQHGSPTRWTNCGLPCMPIDDH
jgi:hypothetical protein